MLSPFLRCENLILMWNIVKIKNEKFKLNQEILGNSIYRRISNAIFVTCSLLQSVVLWSKVTYVFFTTGNGT